LSLANVRAHGSGLSSSGAVVPAIAEALERYCSSIYSESDLVTASAEELGQEALDLDTVAAVSANEAAHPKCPIKKPSKQDVIRWVPGVSLTERRATLIPAVMVYSRLSMLLPGERFWLPISTGCAAHTDLGLAIRAGLFEVAERDAISLTWLQQLPLTQIELDHVPEELSPYVECYRRASIDMEFHLYDATTDIGIPVVYGIRVAAQSASVHTVVACSASPRYSEAIAKVMRDLVTVAPAFENSRQVPANLEDFTQMFHGATYMARRENAHGFNFLLKSGKSATLSRTQLCGAENRSLHDVLESLHHKNISVYAVDLTTDEARRVGMRVVRVIVPSLQPLSFSYKAQYKGNPRLYAAPAAMGYRPSGEDGLNCWPQPFA
jgi:ribosomal protein S12 methylthiotransferase accessory factor